MIYKYFFTFLYLKIALNLLIITIEKDHYQDVIYARSENNNYKKFYLLC